MWSEMWFFLHTHTRDGISDNVGDICVAQPENTVISGIFSLWVWNLFKFQHKKFEKTQSKIWKLRSHFWSRFRPKSFWDVDLPSGIIHFSLECSSSSAVHYMVRFPFWHECPTLNQGKVGEPDYTLHCTKRKKASGWFLEYHLYEKNWIWRQWIQGDRNNLYVMDSLDHSAAHPIAVQEEWDFNGFTELLVWIKQYCWIRKKETVEQSSGA